MKKSILLPGLTILFLPFLPRESHAELKYSISDEWMRREIIPPATTLKIDDEFTALAQAAGANIIADVTQISATENVTPYGDRHTDVTELYPISLTPVLGDLNVSASITYDRVSPDTLVFWRRPDSDRLVDLITTQQKQLDGEIGAIDSGAAILAIQEYFAKDHGWKMEAETVADIQSRAVGVKATIPLNAMEKGLRLLIEREMRKRLANLGSYRDYKSLELAYWKDARIVVEQGRNPAREAEGGAVSGAHSPFLMLKTQGENATNFLIGFPQVAPGVTPQQPAKIPNGNRAKQRPRALNQTQILITPTVSKTALAPQVQAKIDWDAAPGLDKQVAFKSQRLPLAEFVGNLGKESGVALSLSPDTFTKHVIFASSAGMKLSDAMKAIERLYSAHWTKANNGYRLETDGLDELHTLLAQEGVFAHYNASRGFLSEQARNEWGQQLADEIMGNVEPEVLKKEGVAFSSLPEELQKQILALHRSDSSSAVIVGQQRFNEAFARGINFRFAPLVPNSEALFGRLQTPTVSMSGFLSHGVAALVTYTDDGKFITELFPKFWIPKPSPIDFIELQRRTRAQNAFEVPAPGQQEG